MTTTDCSPCPSPSASAGPPTPSASESPSPAPSATTSPGWCAQCGDEEYPTAPVMGPLALPVTGPGAELAAGAGIVLVLLGAALLIAGRRVTRR